MAYANANYSDVLATTIESRSGTVADNVTPVRLERGVLTVEVVENAWATQLKFLERQLVNTLREHVGDVVDSLEVKVRRSR